MFSIRSAASFVVNGMDQAMGATSSVCNYLNKGIPSIGSDLVQRLLGVNDYKNAVSGGLSGFKAIDLAFREMDIDDSIDLKTEEVTKNQKTYNINPGASYNRSFLEIIKNDEKELKKLQKEKKVLSKQREEALEEFRNIKDHLAVGIAKTTVIFPTAVAYIAGTAMNVVGVNSQAAIPVITQTLASTVNDVVVEGARLGVQALSMAANSSIATPQNVVVGVVTTACAYQLAKNVVKACDAKGTIETVTSTAKAWASVVATVSVPVMAYSSDPAKAAEMLAMGAIFGAEAGIGLAVMHRVYKVTNTVVNALLK